jgi:hypothetical protein
MDEPRGVKENTLEHEVYIMSTMKGILLFFGFMFLGKAPHLLGPLTGKKM